MAWKWIALSSLICVVILGALFAFDYSQSHNREVANAAILSNLVSRLDSLEDVSNQSKGTIALLRYDLMRLSLRLDIAHQKGRYLVIDRHNSHFWVREGDAVLYEGTCGVGKGKRKVLGKVYNFETPAGKLSILRKVENPWWYRPNWFWKEKGIEVPKNFIEYPKGITFNKAVEFYNSLSKQDKLRVRAVPGHLGKYALQIGDGIYIHYGKARYGHISHGCVRVSEKDLETLYELLDKGAPVYIF